MRFDYLFDVFGASKETPQAYSEMMAQLEGELPPEVSVVGNAASLLNRRDGDLIDQRPTIRFNHPPIVDPKAQGRRWTYVATSNAHTLRYYREHEPQHERLIFTAYLDTHIRALELIGSDRPVVRYPIRLSRELSMACLARPTTGMQILYLLGKLRPRQVHIFGFDWKATPTFYSTRSRDPHRHQRERDIAMALIERNGWVLHA